MVDRRKAEAYDSATTYVGNCPRASRRRKMEFAQDSILIKHGIHIHMIYESMGQLLVLVERWAGVSPRCGHWDELIMRVDSQTGQLEARINL